MFNNFHLAKAIREKEMTCDGKRRNTTPKPINGLTQSRSIKKKKKNSSIQSKPARNNNNNNKSIKREKKIFKKKKKRGGGDHFFIYIYI
jgi:hypothetical protein